MKYTQTVHVEHLPKAIQIGRQTETGVRELHIDVSPWLDRWPGMYISLVVNAPQSSVKYPAVVRMDGMMAVWDITDTDTAQAGTGSVEIVGWCEDKQVVSASVEVIVLARTPGTEGETPEYAKPWVDEVLDAANRVEDASAHPPVIGENGTWMLWDFEAGAYVDSGYMARGAQGEKGEPGPIGPQGVPGPKGDPGDGAHADAVLYTPQTLSHDQQEQARANIGAADVGAVNALSEEMDGLRLEANVSEFTAEGKSVVCFSVEGNDLELAARMVAYQSGTGLPSPENERPIAVFDVLTFTRAEDGAEVTANLGETVAGGTIDLTTGVLTIDRGVLVVNETSNVTRQAANDGDDNICIAWNTGINTNVDKRLEDICDKLPHAVTVHESNWDGANAQGVKYAECFSFGRGTSAAWLYIRLNKSRFAGSYEVADVKAWLAENPLTVTYGLTEPRTVQLAPQTMAALTGKNTLSTNATSMTVRGVDHPIGKTQSDQNYEPKKQIAGLPVLALSGDITGMDKDNAVTLNYVYKDRQGTLTCKWQGSSSLSFDKKNYTVKFDDLFEVVEGWGVQKKYCLKANWIDASHARNVVSAKLWGQVVASRTPANATLAACPNYGAVDGFPIIVTLNGEFLGLYTWNIPKDAWMMNMGDGTNEAILCAEMHVDATKFKAEAKCDESDFTLEYVTDEDNAGWVVTSVNRMINACINSDGTDLDTTVAQYLDLESAIDYMIFVSLLYGQDMTDKNYLLSTFDGVKWFFGGYDMDSTYGLLYTGKRIDPATNWNLSLEWWSNFNRAMNLLYNNKRAKIKERYLALRKGALSDDNVVTTFANFIGLIPANVYRAEQDKWPEIPNSSTSNLHQIADWYCRRAAYIDKEVSKWTV